MFVPIADAVLDLRTPELDMLINIEFDEMKQFYFLNHMPPRISKGKKVKKVVGGAVGSSRGCSVRMPKKRAKIGHLTSEESVEFCELSDITVVDGGGTSQIREGKSGSVGEMERSSETDGEESGNEFKSVSGESKEIGGKTGGVRRMEILEEIQPTSGDRSVGQNSGNVGVEMGVGVDFANYEDEKSSEGTEMAIEQVVRNGDAYVVVEGEDAVKVVGEVFAEMAVSGLYNLEEDEIPPEGV